MFNSEDLEKNITEKLINSASSFIIKDRKPYTIIFKAIEEYAYSHNLVFFGYPYIRLLELSDDEKIINIFKNEPFKFHSFSNAPTAKIALADQFTTHKENILSIIENLPLDSDFIIPGTLRNKSNFNVHNGTKIILNNRTICTFVQYTNINGEIFPPIETHGVFADKVWISSAEYNIIDIYSCLSTISESYSTEMIDEVNHLIVKYQPKITTNKSTYKDNKQNNNNKSDIDNVIQDYSLLSEILEDPNVINIGAFGLLVKNIIKKKDFNNIFVIITEDLNKLKEKIYKIFCNDNIEIKIQNLLVDTDIRLRKLSLSYNNKLILNAFNTLDFEIVPYEQVDTYKIGGIYTMLKYLMMEYYSLFSLEKMGHSMPKNIINTGFYYKKLYEYYLDFRKKRNAEVLFYNNYLGLYYPYSLFLKRENIKKLAKKFK